MGDVKNLHNSTSHTIFINKLKKIFIICKDLGLEVFKSFFEKQWINGPFSNWAIFHSPPGFSTTNNPIESYNKNLLP